MNKSVPILLFLIVLTMTARSTPIHATFQKLQAQHEMRSSGIIYEHRKCNFTFLFEASPNNPSVPGPAEEESEDEDNTSKENFVHKMTSFHLSLVLQQLYGRQNALFDEHHREIESPPPQHLV